MRVNAVAPGWIEIPMASALYSDSSGRIDPELREKVVRGMKNQSPLGILGTTSDIAFSLLYLVVRRQPVRHRQGPAGQRRQIHARTIGAAKSTARPRKANTLARRSASRSNTMRRAMWPFAAYRQSPLQSPPGWHERRPARCHDNWKGDAPVPVSLNDSTYSRAASAVLCSTLWYRSLTFRSFLQS